MRLSDRRQGWILVLATLSLIACSAPDDRSSDSETVGIVEGLIHRGHGHGHGRGGNGHGHGHGGKGGKAGAGTGGTGGISGEAGGSIRDVVGSLDGRLMQFPCADSPLTDDCGGLGYVVDGVVTSCSEGRSEMVLDHPIAGTPGARYLLTMHFYGIMEPKNLGPGVTREAGYLRANRDGGSPTPWATAPAGASYSLSSYSAYELHVHDEGGQEVAQYFLNSELVEEHLTFLIDYERTIEVVAGGFVRLRRYDPNCRLIKNCGATAGPPCASKARTLDLSAANPPAPPPGPFPAGFNQPGLNKSAEHGGQWWMIDVTAVQPI